MSDFTDGLQIQRFALQVGLGLPATAKDNPFGPEYDVLKVKGKMFGLCADTTGDHLSLKCDPEHSRALRQTYEAITPGWHLNKRHWISIHPGPGIDADLVEDLVIESYLLVVEKMPKSQRPTLPDELRGYQI